MRFSSLSFRASGFRNRRLSCRPGLILVLACISCLPARPASALNCVEYVRKVTGLDLEGDAWKWWNAAGGRYDRGHQPKENAILVFDHTGVMEHGHVAVVSKVMNERLITINHANWAHFHSLKGHVSTGVMVQDVSDKNDWSEVKVMDEASHSFGRSNRALGFIYGGTDTASHLIAQTNPQPTPQINQAAEVADNTPPSAPFETSGTKVKDVDNE